MNSNDFSFTIQDSNKQLIYSHGDTCCRLIKTNVLLADHLLRENKLTKDKLSCHIINREKNIKICMAEIGNEFKQYLSQG